MTTRNETFTRLAHRRQVLLELQKIMKDRFIQMDGGQKEPILCPDVMYADRIVSQEALLEVLDALQQLEAMESLGMSEFEFKKRDIPPLRLPPPPKEANAEANVAVQNQPNAPGQEAAKAGDPTNRPGDSGGPAGGQPGSPPG